MFDPAGEHEFIDESRALLRQRTVVLITHRPASLALADRVLRLSMDACSRSRPGRHIGGFDSTQRLHFAGSTLRPEHCFFRQMQDCRVFHTFWRRQ